MPEGYRVTVDRNVPIPLRDGTITYADVWRPAEGRHPVVLQRTPYDKSLTPMATSRVDPMRAAGRGYAVVIQDVRGRYTSEGEFNPLFQEIDDGYDSVEWAGTQPWSTGKVGMCGGSYVGATQWLAAIAQPPHLACILPEITAADYHEGWFYQGGAFELGFLVNWAFNSLAADNIRRKAGDQAAQELARLLEGTDRLCDLFSYLPLNDFPYLKRWAPFLYDWMAHPAEDDYWRRIKVEDFHHRVQVPAFNLGGWHDIFLGGTLRNFTHMRQAGGSEVARRHQQLLIGPWDHRSPYPQQPGEFNYGVHANALVMDLDAIRFRWYDRWLQGADVSDPPVRIFVMGENRWRDEQEWPLARAQARPFYLHSNGHANSLNGDGRLSEEAPGVGAPADRYTYDPRDPVPTRGGATCCTPVYIPQGAFDQRPVEARQDVLCYTSEVLAQDLEVTGPITVKLWAISSAHDTDFTGKLVDVGPDGYARNLTDGIVRARYRDSRAQESLIEPGQAYEYTIDLWSTSNVFKAGHRIRLEIASSNFPRFDRNPNTGHPFGLDAEVQPAQQTILHDAQHPSHVLLPVVPR